MLSTATGTFELVAEPLELMPSWPETFEPQQYTAPSGHRTGVRGAGR